MLCLASIIMMALSSIMMMALSLAGLRWVYVWGGVYVWGSMSGGKSDWELIAIKKSIAVKKIDRGQKKRSRSKKSIAVKKIDRGQKNRSRSKIIDRGHFMSSKSIAVKKIDRGQKNRSLSAGSEKNDRWMICVGSLGRLTDMHLLSTYPIVVGQTIQWHLGFIGAEVV
jgi:hypothetical protein